MHEHSQNNRHIAIIGTGFAGLCMAIQLKKLGHDHFTLFEKADRIGGTWRENTYPGAECDIPSSLYSFSFERNPRWTYKWSEQAEILSYLEHCASKYDINPHIQFNHTIKDIEFNEVQQNWTVSCDSGANGTKEQVFDIVVSAVGQLHKPLKPKIEGQENFRGEQFHSAQWDHQIDLSNKRVNVIGNAASAVQFLPQISPKVKQLNIFQRSANWILPKNDREYFAIEKWLGAAFPILTKFYRFLIWAGAEAYVYQLMNANGPKWLRNHAKQKAIEYIEENIDSLALRKKLIPDYPIGAKRVLFSDDIYEGLNRANVEVLTESIKKIESNGIRTQDNELHECDVLIYATGFDASTFLTPMMVRGKDNVVLNDIWQREGAEAYLGVTHKGFPNFFMMYGPNTNLGHNSIIIMIESQTRYILSCLQALDDNNAKTLDVKPEVQAVYNQEIQDRMKDKIWSAVDKSWYKTAGKVTNNWVGRTGEYIKRTREMNPQDYLFTEKREPDVSTVSSAPVAVEV